jgi:DNA-binding transcriptional LysR family regulator
MPPEASPFLNLRLLHYWVTVVDAGSVTAGARRLSIPQPALSRQIRTLERAIGGPLLERLPHGVRPTDAGEALLPEARATLAAATRSVNVARASLRLEAGALSFGTYSSLAAGALLPSLARWHERYPGVSTRITGFAHGELQEGVERGLVDFGVGLPPRAWSGPMKPIAWDELVLVMPASEPAPRGKRVDLATVADRGWVVYDRGIGLSQLVTAACEHAGFHPRPAVETSQVDAAARLAAAGLGVALVPRDNVPLELRGYVRTLARPPVWRISAFTRRAWSPGASAYIDILREQEWPARPRRAITLELG